jgi:sialic acid synthase SpsE
MKIGSTDTDKEVLLIAEIGNNHEGDFEVAKELVHTAARCGVDAVKFQTFRTEHYVTRLDVARFERLKSFELTFRQFEQLSELAHSLGLLFISTPFDLASANLLESIVDSYKIASGDNDFYPLIDQVVQRGKPVIISTGLSDPGQVARTVEFVKKHWLGHDVTGQVALLHCVSGYPVPPDQANLRSIQFLAENFDFTIGYSDHTTGIEASVLAIALGARIIEKHFTLDKAFSDFHDHQLSADPAEMKELVQRVRLASSLLGNGQKRVQPCEEGAIGVLRRSIAAGRDMIQGHRIALSDLTWIRPADGLAPGEEHILIGKRLKRSVSFGEELSESDMG